MSAQSTQRSRITRRAVVVALLAAAAAAACVGLIKINRRAPAAAASGGTEAKLTTAGSILELDECPGDEAADDIPMNAADE